MIKILFSVFLLLTVSPAYSEKVICSANPSFAEISRKLIPTVVNISTTQVIESKRNNSGNIIPQFGENSPFDFFFKDFFGELPQAQPKKRTVTSLGSGFIISRDGYIVTNNHVIQKADTIDVKFNDGSSLEAKIIGSDPKSDLALLKVKSKKKFKYVAFGNSDKAQVGEWVIAIGNPFGLGGTVTAGIISARGRNISDGSNTDFIQTDAAINRGNSGGPMFNDEGNLIGINTSIFSSSGGNIGIGFAIPSQTAIPIINQLKKHGKVIRGWLGVNIQLITADMVEALGLKNNHGAYVVAVTEDSPAEKAGLKVDDIITRFDGKEITDMYQLPRIVGNTPVNKQVNMEILRKKGNKFVNKTLTTKIVKLDSKKLTKKKTKKDSKKKVRTKEFLGLKLANIDRFSRKKYNLSEKSSGILIIGVKDQSYVHFSGLKKGDIIQKVNQIKVKNIDDFTKIVRKNKKLKRRHILLSVKRGENTTIVVTINIGK